MNKMGGSCGMYEEKDRCMQGFGGKTMRGKNPPGRPKRRWENNIKIDL